jgi:hypothetical protein
MDELAEEFARDRVEAYRAYKNGDYATALRLFRAIEAYIETLPNQTRETISQEWRAGIKTMIDRLQRLVAASGDILARPIEYRRPGLCTRCE